MTRPAPHADRIRLLRRQIARGVRAAADLTRLDHALHEQRHGKPSSLDSIYRELTEIWHVDAGSVSVAESLRTMLADAAASLPSLREEFGQLQHDQLEQLKQPEWSDTLDTVRRLTAAQKALRPTLQGARARQHGVTACRHTTEKAIARVEAASPKVFTALAEASAKGIQDILRAFALESLAPSIQEPASWLKALVPRLSQEAEQLAPQLAELERQSSELDRDISHLLG